MVKIFLLKKKLAKNNKILYFKEDMRKNNIYIHLKNNIVLYLLLVVLLVTGVLVNKSFDSGQSYNASPLKLEFSGKYSYDGENWKDITKDTKIKSKELVYLQGSFNHDLPEYFIINFYLNHIDMEFIYNNKTYLRTTGLEMNGRFRKYSCGKYWAGIKSPTLTAGEVVTIKLYNSHKFGNGSAISEFLDNIYVGETETIKTFLEPTYQAKHFIGYIVLLLSLLLFGAFLSSLILKFKVDINTLLLSLILIGTGFFMLFDVKYVLFAFTINRVNTTSLVISLILTTLFISMYNINNIKNKTYFKISKIIIIIECIFVSFLMGFVLFDVKLMYDILPYWIIAENIINLILVVVNILDIIKTKTLVLMKSSIILIFIALMLDTLFIFLAYYSDFKIFKTAISIFILYNFFIVIKMICLAFKSSIENKKLQNIVNYNEISIKISQIQPHFLYNSLNSIYYLCEKNPKQAQIAIKNFSEYLHGNLEFLSKSEFIKVKDELSFVNKYLELEIMRYGDKIKVIQEIENEDFEIPALIIQPLVENSIKHGLSKKSSGGTITINTVNNDMDYTITIIDDGVGFDSNSYNKDGNIHIGIENVKKRIESLCSGEFVIESNINEGTKITIIIPK